MGAGLIVATSTQNVPIRPAHSAGLPGYLHKFDSSEYRNGGSLADGAVLAVGSGQSGGQIADDLVRSGRKVFLATSRVGMVLRNYRGRHTMRWLISSGFLDVTRAELLRNGPIAARPPVGARETISLQSLSAPGVVLLGRLTGTDGRALHFSDEVEKNVQYADEVAATVRQEIDGYIAREGIEAPDAAPDPTGSMPARLPAPVLRSLDPRAAGIGTVIWCMGFRGDFGWTHIPGLLDDRGQPVQEAGFAWIPGAYFPGLPFSLTRRSGTLMAIAEEAERIAGDIQGFAGPEPRPCDSPGSQSSFTEVSNLLWDRRDVLTQSLPDRVCARFRLGRDPMFATANTRKWPFLSALEGLKTFHPGAALGRRRGRPLDREGEADLDRLSLQALDELGLLSGEGCATEWGLVEGAARLRSGRS